MEKRPHDGAALRVGHVHQGVEIRQQGVSGLQHTSGHIHEGSIPGHRVLPLKEKSVQSSPQGPGNLRKSLNAYYK